VKICGKKDFKMEEKSLRLSGNFSQNGVFLRREEKPLTG